MNIIGGCRIQKGRVIGWAKDAERDESLEIEVSTDGGETIWKGKASVFRPDLEAKGIGHGNYGFACQIPAHLLNCEFSLHVREVTSGVDLPNSPVAIGEAFHAYRKRLLSMVSLPVWGITSHNMTGRTMTITGYLVAPEGEAELYGIYVGGRRVAEMSEQERNVGKLEDLKNTFWFSTNNENIGFQVTINVDEYLEPNKLDQTPSIKVSMGKDDQNAEHPLRIIYIPVLSADSLILPDTDRRKRVQRNTSDVQFVTYGYSHYHYYRHLYEHYSKQPWNEMEKMLDWGCGCGRVSQFIIRSLQDKTLVGVDIDKDNVKWCQDHLKGGVFEVSELYPPLQFADDTFNFMVATSVFTHLERDVMMQWLAELARVLKPGGIAALTVNTDCTPAWRSFDEETLDLINRDGIYDKIVSPDLGNHLSEKDYYKNVFMSKAFISENWSKYFDILDIQEHVFGYQDVVICRGR